MWWGKLLLGCVSHLSVGELGGSSCEYFFSSCFHLSFFFFLPSKYLSFKVSEKLALCKLVLCKKHNYLKVYLRLYLLNFIS